MDDATEDEDEELEVVVIGAVDELLDVLEAALDEEDELDDVEAGELELDEAEVEVEEETAVVDDEEAAVDDEEVDTADEEVVDVLVTSFAPRIPPLLIAAPNLLFK